MFGYHKKEDKGQQFILSEEDKKEFVRLAVPVNEVDEINLHRTPPINISSFMQICHEIIQMLGVYGVRFNYSPHQVLRAIILQYTLFKQNEKKISIVDVLICMEMEKRYRVKNRIDANVVLTDNQRLELEKKTDSVFAGIKERMKDRFVVNQKAVTERELRSSSHIVTETTDDLILVNAVFLACGELGIKGGNPEALKELSKDPRWKEDPKWKKVLECCIKTSREQSVNKSSENKQGWGRSFSGI